MFKCLNDNNCLNVSQTKTKSYVTRAAESHYGKSKIVLKLGWRVTSTLITAAVIVITL